MTGDIRFLLGGEERALAGVPPTMTVLQYLRRVERRMGTKEGCAEGDCGACTVILTEPDGRGGLLRRAVNSCIQFVPSLHGRMLETVEDLSDADGGLGPVQQALVEAHGSQCGFCTPGFVVQIEAGRRAGRLGDRQGVKDWIAGNLCRCTGYGPIVDAALSLHGSGEDEVDEALAARLADLTGGNLAYEHDGQAFFQPADADELAELYLAHPDAVLVAGATDVGLWVTKAQRALPKLIDVTRVPELARIEETDAGLALGATVTHARAAPALARLHPDLGELLRRFAGEQVRAAGTVGGNIANGSPIGDLPPALIALDATLTLRRGSERRRLPLERFFIAYGKQNRAPGEFVESVTIPRLAPNTRFACYKVSKRLDSDISAVMAAFRIAEADGVVSEARLAFGGMAATPRRAAAAEAALLGARFDAAAARRAAAALAEDFAPVTDLRATSAYRLQVAGNLIVRFALENAASGPATRILALADG